MSDLLLARLTGENDDPIPLNAAHVVDATTGQSVSAFMRSMEEFKSVVDAFLTGEDNGNEVIDRASEIVAAIKANKDLINTAINGSLKPTDIINDLVTGGADKVLSAEQGKALKGMIDQIHKFANAAVLDKFSQNEQGELLFDGQAVQGETGIAFGATPEEATKFTDKIKIIFDKVTVPSTDEGSSEDSE